MRFARHSLGGDPAHAAVTLGIRLDAVRLLPREERESYGGFSVSMLDRQMDFLRSLRGLPEGCAVEIRYLRDPDDRHRLRIGLLVRAEGESEAAADRTCTEAGQYVLDLLTVHHPFHTFCPIDDPQELRRFLTPFPFRDVVEILRREVRIALDAVRHEVGSPLGFADEACGPDPLGRVGPGDPPCIYYAFPFALSLENLERLCNALLLVPGPCLLSVVLRPYRLTPADEQGLERRIRLCEKFAQLNLDGRGDLEKLEPFLKGQATALYKNCSREFLQLRDAAFLAGIRLASPEPVPQSLVATVGASLTEHTGHPKPAFPDALEDSFTGGYAWHRPEGAAERRAALRSLERLEAEPWVPGVAEPGERHWRSLFSVDQAAAAFRLPLPVSSEFPGVETQLYQPKTAPSELPEEGVFLGEHLASGRVRRVYCLEDDRRRHSYVVGQTGTGKSTLFLGMIQQDVEAGRGVGVIDPHGELIEEVLATIPKEREGDVVYLDPTDVARPIGINMLDAKTPLEKDFSINYLIDVFDLLYDLRSTGGPIFEMYMRNALQLLVDQPEGYRPTVVDVPPVFQDRKFRKQLLEKCDNPYVVNFWTKEAEQAGGDARLENVAPYITSKLTRFVYNEIMRGILGQRATTVDFRRVIDEGKILLVDLRKGLLGDMNSHFLGMMVVGKIFAAALGRTGAEDKSALRDFFLYVDEFHNLATKTFVSILSEARKYRLSLVLTNQYVAQLPDYIVHGILGNVGTLVSFRVGTQDAELLSKAFSGVVSPNDLLGLPNWHTYLRLLAHGNVTAPFDMRTVLPATQRRKGAEARVRRLSRKAHGVPRKKVEAEIRRSWIGKG